MTSYLCPRCKAMINVPAFNLEEKNKLMNIQQNESFIILIKEISKCTKLSMKDAKALSFHMNKKGKCHRCNYNELSDENTICPKCKSFNTNW